MSLVWLPSTQYALCNFPHIFAWIFVSCLRFFSLATVILFQRTKRVFPMLFFVIRIYFIAIFCFVFNFDAFFSFSSRFVLPSVFVLWTYFFFVLNFFRVDFFFLFGHFLGAFFVLPVLFEVYTVEYLLLALPTFSHVFNVTRAHLL